MTDDLFSRMSVRALELALAETEELLDAVAEAGDPLAWIALARRADALEAALAAADSL